MKKLNINKYWLALLGLLPTSVLAQSPITPINPGLPGDPGATIAGVVHDTIAGIILPIVGIICVLFIIIGGFQYITSGGNEELAERGKKTLTNAIIGLVIVILSYVIVVVIANAFVM